MPTYYDALNDAYKLFEANPPASSAQLVYLHLLHLNNCLGNAGRVQISDRALSLRTGLSKDSITNAKRTLKNRGLIDFSAKRDKSKQSTTYDITFFSEKAGQVAGQGAGHKAGQVAGQIPGQSSFISYTQESTKRREEKDDDASAREVETVTEPQATDTRPKPLSSPKSDANEIQAVWQQSFGFALFGDNALTLEQLATEDFARAELAIKKTAARNLTTTNPSAVLAYFRKVYESTPPTPQQTPKTKKTSFEDQFDWDAIKAQLELTGGK